MESENKANPDPQQSFGQVGSELVNKLKSYQIVNVNRTSWGWAKPSSGSSSVETVITKNFSSKGWEMAEIWAVMEFNPIKVINPMGDREKICHKFRPSIRKKSWQKNSAEKDEKWKRYGLLWNSTLTPLWTSPDNVSGLVQINFFLNSFLVWTSPDMWSFTVKF